MSSFRLGQTGLLFQPGMKLKILNVHSCQLSKPTVVKVSFSVGIFRYENAVFSERERSVRLFLSTSTVPILKV